MRGGEQAAPSVQPSKNQLKMAGDRIRKRLAGTHVDLDGQQAADDIALIQSWRSAHSGPLTTTRIGLGYCVARVLGVTSQAGLVTQRLKRFDSIVSKLVRAQTRLGEMEDIAGCRAVLNTLDQVREVHRQLAKAPRLEIVAVKDYVASPHAGGYRALHLWCKRDGFKIEIQLRSTRQQVWAEAVERWDLVTGYDLKHESGSEQALVYFRELANCYHQLDIGVAHSDVDTSALDRALDELGHWLKEEGHRD